MIYIIIFLLVGIVLAGLHRILLVSANIRAPILRRYLRWVYRGDFDLCRNELQHMGFYLLLLPHEQEEFLYRVFYLTKNKLFVGREGLKITPQMKVLVCAALAQLTFGYSQYSLPRLVAIYLYPGPFFSKRLQVQVKGLSIDSHTLMLSWPDFCKGYASATDGINLGLHELSHSLWTYMQYLNSDFTDIALLKLRLHRQTIRQNTPESDPLFRDYAFTDDQEFWACCVEIFFESPLRFEVEHPELYNLMRKLLLQDMAERWRRIRKN
ncbi:MAG: zinc-dependent peptidase [Chitinophagales bacterium]|nr:zinc-dependent peptidase [Chitinophagales bacterium]MDW8420106.1 zinc-dependent peptidase [Chitinophagales bacterium]